MERVNVFIPPTARLHTIAAFGLRPGKGLVTVSKPLQACDIILIYFSS